LFRNMPGHTHAGSSVADIAPGYKKQAIEELESQFGEDWTELPDEVLKPYLGHLFAQPVAA